MRSLKDHVDSYGQLVQMQSRDDMDSAQRHGMTYIGLKLNKKYYLSLPSDIWDGFDLMADPYRALKQFESPLSPGNYMRSGNPASRGYYPDMLTRDQQTGIIALMLITKPVDKVRKLMRNNFKRYWRTNNWTSHRTDRETEPDKVGTSHPNFAGLSQLAMCFRSLDWWWTYPLICLLDAELIYSSLKYRLWDKQREPLNHVLRCGIVRAKYATPTGWLACKILNAEDIHQRLIRYFDRGEDKGPPLYRIWTVELLKKIF